MKYFHPPQFIYLFINYLITYFKGANVTGWAYATTTRDENAMKIAVATYGALK